MIDILKLGGALASKGPLILSAELIVRRLEIQRTSYPVYLRFREVSEFSLFVCWQRAGEDGMVEPTVV